MKKLLLILAVVFLLLGLFIYNKRFVMQGSQRGTSFESSSYIGKSMPLGSTSLVNSSQDQTKSNLCQELTTKSSDLTYCLYKRDISNNGYIKYRDVVILEKVHRYSVSPTGNWALVVTDSGENFQSAPSTSSLYMLNVESGVTSQLFSIILEPAFSEAGWTKKGDGIVITAGAPAKPYNLDAGKPFSVVYCTTTCKVLATNAGPDGVSPVSPYFENGTIVYFGAAGETITLPFRLN